MRHVFCLLAPWLKAWCLQNCISAVHISSWTKLMNKAIHCTNNNHTQDERVQFYSMWMLAREPICHVIVVILLNSLESIKFSCLFQLLIQEWNLLVSLKCFLFVIAMQCFWPPYTNYCALVIHCFDLHCFQWQAAQHHTIATPVSFFFMLKEQIQ